MCEEDQKRQQDLERLRRLRPIDDDFMRCLFKDNRPLAELVLRIITGKPDLVITEFQTQKDMKRLAGARSICLDASGTDADGKNTIWKSSGRTKAQIRTGQDIIPVCKMWRIWTLGRSLINCRTPTRSSSPRRIFMVWANPSIGLSV